MRRQRTGYATGIVLAFLMVTGAAIWAQGGDTPIVIMDGSLTMQSPVPWKQFTGSGDRKSHPNTAGSIRSVVVTIAGKDQTVTCGGQACAVDVMYAGTDIKVASGAGGKGLTISPFSAFQAGNTEGILMHKNQNAKISHVTVTKAGAKVFDSAASGGGTKVVIDYR